jgi:3-deoxy-D-manno-octulosonic-acid transferase
MLTFFYDCIQFLGALAYTPKLLKRKLLLKYLGFKLPPKTDKKGPSFLLYAVSMGETRALIPLFNQLKKNYPEGSFYIASRTETGHEEAKKSLPTADAHFILPFDFSWVSRSLLAHFAVDVLIVMEGDLWFNLLKEARKRGSLVILVSGKISERSYRRFLKVPFLAKRIFSLFDLITAQSEIFRERFTRLGANSFTTLATGNVKMGACPLIRGDDSLLERLGLSKEGLFVVAGSTHEGEESLILDAFQVLWKRFPSLKLFLVPRHPERFAHVKELLEQRDICHLSFSSMKKSTGKEQVFLVDAMGYLASFYGIANIAIACGSFLPDYKGHNILEPIQSGCPVVFGPYMSNQQDLVELVLFAKAGLQVRPDGIASAITALLEDPLFLECLKQGGAKLLDDLQGSFRKTWDPIEGLLRAFLA